MRKKLTKLLGKSVRYEGVVDRFENESVLLINITHEGKTYTDHVWVNLTKSCMAYEPGEHLSFLATAVTYTDSKGIRKHGLSKVCQVCLVKDRANLEDFKHNKKMKARRK